MDTVKVEILKPIFKNGQEIAAGSKMDMELQTAFRFQGMGDVKILDKITTEIQTIEVARRAE